MLTRQHDSDSKGEPLVWSSWHQLEFSNLWIRDKVLGLRMAGFIASISFEYGSARVSILCNMVLIVT